MVLVRKQPHHHLHEFHETVEPLPESDTSYALKEKVNYYLINCHSEDGNTFTHCNVISHKKAFLIPIAPPGK